MKESPVLIGNEMMWKKGRLTLQIVARISSDGRLCKGAGLVMCGVVPLVSHMPSWCAQGQLNVTFIRL